MNAGVGSIIRLLTRTSKRKCGFRTRITPVMSLTASGPPSISIVIGVFNDWLPLEACLSSIAAQESPPSFEVIVVDDGSMQVAPETISSWRTRLPLKIMRQHHAGLTTARNCGIKQSTGEILLFIDADCNLRPDCLVVLAHVVSAARGHDCFQLRLVGSCIGLVGRAENLRLMTLQEHMLGKDGRIRYFNTAGAAVRRSRALVEGGSFDPNVFRAGDTLFLSVMIQSGQLPLFVDRAVVEHAIPLSLTAYVSKGLRTGYVEGRTFQLIAARGVRIRSSLRDRIAITQRMWRISRRPGIGRIAWSVVIAKQVFTALGQGLFRVVNH